MPMFSCSIRMMHLKSSSLTDRKALKLQETVVNQHYLYPGTLFAHRKPHRVTTVLGSCLSVCLWSASSRLGGINHFLLPRWDGEGLPTPKYGNIATIKLIEKIRAIGAKGKIVAKVFGGASTGEPTDGQQMIGQQNIEQASELLEQYKIPIISKDVGGSVGRKIIFNTEDGSVILKLQRAHSAG